MIKIYSVSSIDELQVQRKEYGKRLPFAQDLNIEENIWDSNYYKIEYDSRLVGYTCIDTKRTLWEFYLEENACLHSQEIFQYLIDICNIGSTDCNIVRDRLNYYK
jgi:hypothetical protein